MFLTAQPLWLSGLLIVGLTTLLSAASPILVRHTVGPKKLRISNEVAGLKVAAVGVSRRS